MRSAVTRRNHGDVVSRTCAAVLASIPEECRDVSGCVFEFALADRELVIEGELVECNVVGVDVLPGFNRNSGAADDLAVANDISPCRDRLQRNLVARGNRVTHADIVAIDSDFVSLRQGNTRDGYVVGLVEMNGRVLRRRDLRNL